jgi:hypothetical protein
MESEATMKTMMKTVMETVTKGKGTKMGASLRCKRRT